MWLPFLSALPAGSRTRPLTDRCALQNMQALNQSVAAGGPLQGVLFWLWDARSEGTDTRSSNQGITSSDSTWCDHLGCDLVANNMRQAHLPGLDLGQGCTSCRCLTNGLLKLAG